jgi:hypothetical protein
MAFNATTAQTYYELAYAGTDFDSLSWLEQQWVAWYIWIGNPIIATGLMSFLMHEVHSSPPLVFCISSSGSLDCLLWSFYTMDHHRRNPILSEVEAPTKQNPFTSGAMALYQTSIVLPLHHRITSGTFFNLRPPCLDPHYGSLDLVLSPNGRGARHEHLPSPFTFVDDNGASDCDFLRVRRLLSLSR